MHNLAYWFLFWESAVADDSRQVQGIRCPAGWTPAGPLCSVTVSVYPFTECPLQKKRYRKPYVSISGFETPSVGYCISQEGTGVQVRCPLGLSLELTPLDGGPTEFPNGDFFKGDETIWTRQSQYKCVGVDQRVLAPEQFKSYGSKCPPGYHLKQQFLANETLYPDANATVICEGFPVLPPDVFCPQYHRPVAIDYNPANFLGTRAVKCIEEKRFKGRLWCPDTFRIVRENFPGIPFGGEIPASLPATGFDPYIYDNLGFILSPGPSCIRSIAVHHSKCDQFQCRDPVIDEIRHLVKHFGYFARQRDPRYILFESLPTGKDLRWSPNGRFVPF